ncbi:MAG: insulinase family protein [Myxococcales bacterium]|jgi:zinc protease|nr:insulinase family protein [Myxococcales bacterium]
MLRWLTLLLLLVHVASPARGKVPQGAPANPLPIRELEVEGVQSYRLSNGLRVLLVPEPSAASLTVEVAYSVGSRHEGYGEAGMAHLLEHLMFKGTARFPKPDEEINRRGGEWNAETEVDHTRYYQTHLPSEDNLRVALALEADRMTQVRFRQDDLSREFQVVRNELELADSDPRDILLRRIHHAAFSVHSYGRDPIGTRSDIERVSLVRLQAFYARHYRPDNAHLIISGPIAPEKMLQLVGELFGKIRPVGPPPERTYTEEPAQDGERHVTVRRVGKLPLVGLYYHAASAADPDQAALAALADILTRPGSGRLYKALVDTGLAVSVAAESELRAEPGGLLVLAELRSGGDPSKVEQTMTRIIEEVAQKGVSPEELRRFQVRALVSHERLVRSPTELVHALGVFSTLGDFRLLFLLRDRMQRLDLAAVQQAARRYLSRQNRTVAQFLPEELPPMRHARPTVDVATMLRDFQGGAKAQPGEPFVQTPAAIAQRVVEKQLPTGLRLIMLPKRTRGQHVELAMQLSLGNQADLRGKESALGLLAPLLLRGTKLRDHQALLDELDLRKATLATKSEAGLPGLLSQHLEVTGSTVRSELPGLLALLHEILATPGLAPAEFERAKQQALAQTEDLTHNPMAQAMIQLLRHAAPWPKGDPRYVPTTSEQLARLQATGLEDVRFVARELMGGEHALLVLIGDFEPEAVFQQVSKLFAGFVAKRPFARLPRPHQRVASADLAVQLPDRDSAVVAMLLPFACKDTDPDYPALLLWQQIFGASTTSRLNQRLRERDGLSYEVRSSLRIPTLDDNANVAALATCAPPNGKSALTAVQEELRLLLDKGPSAVELSQAQIAYDRQLEAMMADDDDLALLLLQLAKVGRDIRYVEQLRAQVRQVTLAQVLAAAQRHLAAAPVVRAITHE